MLLSRFHFGEKCGCPCFADATEANRTGSNSGTNQNGGANDGNGQTGGIATYKARIHLTQQSLKDPQGNGLQITPGMQIVAEINQGQRTVLEYLLSPVQKAVQEAGRER